MSLKLTYFVHSTTVDNENNVCTGWDPGELSELGLEQAKELPQLIDDSSFEVVYCSDLKRAVESAQLGFGDTHPIIQDQRLREANYGELNSARRPAFNPQFISYIDQPFPGGECLRDVEKRMADFLNYAQQKYPDSHIAIISHRYTQLSLEVLLNNQTWEEALKEDWRLSSNWQPGWVYQIN